MTAVLRVALVAAAAIGWVERSGAAVLTPVTVEQFFVAPDEPATLKWRVEPGTLDAPAAYTVRDYWGSAVSSGTARKTAAGHVEVRLTVPRGFYDVEFPAQGQRFGLIALPKPARPLDPFFCIDAALSWLVHDAGIREGLIKGLNRSGVVMARERLSWGGIHPAEGRWEWEASPRYESLRRLYPRHGVEMLEMFHDAPAWLGRVGKYPEDLVRTAAAWREIARRYRPTWSALEVWNEPDISFGAFLPADQYVPLVKTIAYAFAAHQVEVPLVGGVMAHGNRPFLDTAARNGLLDCVDVFSFHTYQRAPEMESLVGQYRDWLKTHGREAMPLWLTECGRPWKRGPERAPVEEDAASALDITMKAVEARACGVSRYFAFVYPFYEENQHNFGMMDKRATPLRSMGAYAQLIAVLAHKRYLGDLKCDEKAIQRARVFGDQRETVAVVYTGQIQEQAKLSLGLPVLRVEGIDGRALATAVDGSVPIPDGLVYLWLDRDRIKDRLQTDTPAMKMATVGVEQTISRPTPSPLVLRYQFEPSRVAATSEGYRVKTEAAGDFPITVRVFNLAEEPRALTLKLDVSSSAGPVAQTQSISLDVPRRAFADATWKVNLQEAFAGSGRLVATVSATGDAPDRPGALVFELIRAEKATE